MCLHDLRYKDEAMESEDEAEEDEAEGHKKPKPKPNKAKKKKKNAKKKNPKKKAEPKKKKAGSKQLPGSKSTSAQPYCAGSFNDERMRFIRSAMQEQGVAFREANGLWVQSSERATLLKGMSQKELVRRRFVQPAKPRAKV